MLLDTFVKTKEKVVDYRCVAGPFQALEPGPTPILSCRAATQGAKYSLFQSYYPHRPHSPMGCNSSCLHGCTLQVCCPNKSLF